jgi:hypothetical protein
MTGSLCALLFQRADDAGKGISIGIETRYQSSVWVINSGLNASMLRTTENG